MCSNLVNYDKAPPTTLWEFIRVLGTSIVVAKLCALVLAVVVRAMLTRVCHQAQRARGLGITAETMSDALVHIAEYNECSPPAS